MIFVRTSDEMDDDANPDTYGGLSLVNEAPEASTTCDADEHIEVHIQK